MLKLGKGVAFFFAFCGMFLSKAALGDSNIEYLNWLPLFAANMAKFQPDAHCPQNQINGLQVNKIATKINATIREANWDLNCHSHKTKDETLLSQKEQINALLAHLSKLPLFNLHVSHVNLTANLLKKKLSATLSVEKTASQFIVKLKSDPVVAHLSLDLLSKKINIDVLVKLDKIFPYIELTDLPQHYLNSQLSLQYQSDLNLWNQGSFTANWQGVITDFSDHVDLSLSGDINLLKKQLILSSIIINAKQVRMPLSETQVWKTQFIKLKISEPAIINLAPVQIHKLPMQLRIGSSHLLTKVPRGKSQRIRIDKQKIPPIFLQLATHGNKQELLVDWKLRSLNQDLLGKLLIDANFITLQLSENTIDLKSLMPSLNNYVDSLLSIEIEKGELKFDILGKYNRNQNTLLFDSTISSPEITGKDGNILFDGLSVYSRLHYLIDEQKKMTVIEDKQLLKVDNLFVGIPIQALQLDAKVQAGEPVIQHFKARLLGGRVDFDDFKLNAPSQTILNIGGISLAELIKYSAYPEIQGKGLIDGMLPLTLTNNGPEINDGIVFARHPGGYIKVPENTVIKAMGRGNPAVLFTLQLLSNFHFDTLEGRIGYTSDGESDLKVKIKGISPEVSGEQPINFNYSHNENILKLLKTLRFSDELVRDIKERY